MSKYTTELRFICETEAGLSESVGYNSLNSVLNASRAKIFSFDFPIFDEAYRSVLENKILKHYYTREISEETYGLWKLRLDTKMNEIMPYYNQLYASTLLDFNPLYDVELSKHHAVEKGGKNTSNNTSSGNTVEMLDNSKGIAQGTVNLYSDTPQGAVDTDDLFTSAEGGTYLSNARKLNNDIVSNSTDKNEYNKNSVDTGETDFENTETYLEYVAGKTGSGSFSKMLMEYRDTFLNIDMMIINDLADLFFKLY